MKLPAFHISFLASFLYAVIILTTANTNGRVHHQPDQQQLNENPPVSHITPTRRLPSIHQSDEETTRYLSWPSSSRKDSRLKKSPQQLRDKKPNIILILTDDQDIELGSMNYMPKTLRILGEGGAQFSNAYVTTPMCCPSRSSMLTGLYVHNHQVHTNNDNCSSPWWQQEHESRTFATYLNNAGYRTAYFGKYLNEYNGSYIPPGWREWVGLIRNSRFYNYTINVNGNKIKHGDDYYKDYYPDLIANDSVSFLRRSKRHFVNKPVMMVLSFPSPHGPEDAAPHFQHLFLNVTTHRTPSWNYAPNPDKQWLLRNTGKMEPIHVKFTDMLHTKRLQTLQSVDDAVEKLYRELRNLGELENTYIFYTSDHGYHLGQFGLVKGKSMPFEFDVRVPFFVRGPRIPQGIRIQDIVLNIDLAPTFLDIAGVEVPEHMDGRSMLTILKDADSWMSSGHRHIEVRRKKSWRDSFLIERGVVNPSRKGGKNTFGIISPFLTRLTKDQRLAIECKKLQYTSPCQPYQKWECVHDGYRWRIQKCRSYASHRQNCVCPDIDDIDYDDWDIEEVQHKPSLAVVAPARKRKHMDPEEKRLQRLFLSEHTPKGFHPVFIGTRWKRNVGESPVDDFDVDGVTALYALLDATIGPKTEEEMHSHLTMSSADESDEDDDIEDDDDFDIASKEVNFEGVTMSTAERGKRETPDGIYIGLTSDCVLLPNGTKSCFNEKYKTPAQWREKKEKLDGIIKKLRQKLEELKDLRKQMKKTRPAPVNKHYFGPDPYKEDTFRKPCTCEPNDNIDIRQQLKDERRQQREDIRRERQMRREEHVRKMERKIRRKSKFENMTCNAERMNCFTQDNNHWKTPPLWIG